MTQNRRYNYWSRIVGNKDIKYFKNEKAIKKALRDGIKTTISHKRTIQESAKFPVKSKTDFQHKYNVVCYSMCSNEW